MPATTVTTYKLPQSWAPIIVNDDWTGIEEEEIYIVENFLGSMLKPNQYLVLWGDEPEFLKYHDAEPFGWLADDCLEFMVIE